MAILNFLKRGKRITPALHIPSTCAIIPIQPMITEKGTFLNQYQQYIFQVEPSSTKREIKETVHSLWGVHPIKIRVMNIKGKEVRYGRARGKTKNRKKAIVTIKAGEKIEFK